MDHNAPGRVARHKDHADFPAAQVLFQAVKGAGFPVEADRLRQADRRRHEVIRHRHALPFRLRHNLPALALAAPLPEFVHVRFGQQCLSEPPGAQHMVVMPVGQVNLHRFVRQRPYTRLHVLHPVSGVEQRRAFSPLDQRKTDAHGVPDMFHPRGDFSKPKHISS